MVPENMNAVRNWKEKCLGIMMGRKREELMCAVS